MEQLSGASNHGRCLQPRQGQVKLLENPECQRRLNGVEGYPTGAVAFSGGMQPVHGDLPVGGSWGNKCSGFLPLSGLLPSLLGQIQREVRGLGSTLGQTAEPRKRPRRGESEIWGANERYPAQLHCWLTPGEGRVLRPHSLCKVAHTDHIGGCESACLVSCGRVCFLLQLVHRNRQWLLLRALPCAHLLHLSVEALFTDLRKSSIGSQWFPNVTK